MIEKSLIPDEPLLLADVVNLRKADEHDTGGGPE
jgi:hypothetical protein